MNRLFRELRRIRESLRRNEQRVAWLLAAAIGLACIGFVTPPVRDRFLARAQASIGEWDTRWTERVERGEGLVADGRYEEAAAYLERLDAAFPARHVKHGRDVERERVLRALGQANLALGRKRAALDALRRAVEFDGRNYLNHFTLATAALQLNEPEEALAAFERVLAIYPGHLPTVAALIAHYFGQSDYRAVAETYEAYLDAYLIDETTIELGAGVARADVMVDGRDHEIDVPLVAGSGSEPARGRSLSIDGGAYATRVAAVTLVPARRAGVLDADPIALDPPDGWGDGNGAIHSGTAVVVPIGAEVQVARARIVLRLLKPVDAQTWEMVATSYRNLLQTEALRVARRRSVVLEEESS